MKQTAKINTILREPFCAISLPAKIMAETAPSPIVRISTPMRPDFSPYLSIIWWICGAQAPILKPLMKKSAATAQRPKMACLSMDFAVLFVISGGGQRGDS